MIPSSGPFCLLRGGGGGLVHVLSTQPPCLLAWFMSGHEQWYLDASKMSTVDT